MNIQPTTKAEFLVTFNRLCVALREPADDSGVTVGIYFDALADCPIEAIQAGATALMRETGRKWFPTTAEWRTAIDQAQTTAWRLALPSGREQPWVHECEACEDTGWVMELECDGGADRWPEDGPAFDSIGRFTPSKGKVYQKQERATETPRAAFCGRTKPHLPHSFTRVCSCRPTNRTYQRHQASR